MNELNAKVAKILGWTSELGFFGVLWHRPGDVRGWPMPQFDSDPALLPEMLAWLHKNAAQTDLCDLVGLGEWEASALPIDKNMERIFEHGATIFEAVARLVVAVAEEKP